MKLKFITFVSISCLFFFNTNCSSVQKTNAHIDSKIPVKDLQKDIDYVEYKLNKLHPSLDWYISKEDLHKKFDSLRTTIVTPLTPNEFFLAISPVIASVKQGHMGIFPLNKKTDKKELKALNKLGKHPLSLMMFRYQDDNMYLLKNYTKDTLIKTGSKVISVQGIEPKQLYDKYRKTYGSDGLNTTFLPYAFASRFSMFLMLEKPIKDSVHVVFNYKDSIYERTITRAGLTNKDSVAKVAPEKIIAKLSKEEKRAKAIENKKISTRNKLFLYDKTTKEFTRSLTYIPSDSTIAVLKIKAFQHTRHKKAYDSIFNEIKSKGVKTLVLDLRYNGGGSLAEIHNFYSYLSPEPFVFIDTVRVTTRTAVATNKLRSFPKVLLVAFSPVVLPFLVKNILAVKKDEKGQLYLKSKEQKLTEPKPNRFDGKLYVLTNGGSFSASCILSSNLKNSNRAVFVGEETGGTYNGTVAGTMPLLKLPNSKLLFRIGLQDIRPVKQTTEFGRGILPDVTIIPTSEQITDNKDPELDWIIEDAKNN